MTNRKLSHIWIIFGFALAHAASCLLCRSMEIEDEHALTLLTIAMSAILCFRKELKLLYTIAAVIMVNVVAYLLGNTLPKVLTPILGESMWVNILSTTITTLLLGFTLEWVLRLVCKRTSKPSYRQRWIVRINDRIVPVKTEQIAYFYSEDKSNYLVTTESEKYLIDSTMDAIVKELDPAQFFRINRGCILSLPCIDSAVKDSGRLVVEAHPTLGVQMIVTRSRVDDFLDWLA